MTVPQFFRGGGERAIASFTTGQIEDGINFVKYFGASGFQVGVQTYLLSSQETPSHFPATLRNSVGTTEINFDTSTFNLPRTVKGTAILSFARHYNSTEQKDITIRILKVLSNGSTEVALSSAISLESGGSVITGSKMEIVKIPLTQTIIKKGEFLRLEILMIQTAGANAFEIGHDPADKDGSNITPSSDVKVTTVMKLFVPYRLAI